MRGFPASFIPLSPSVNVDVQCFVHLHAL